MDPLVKSVLDFPSKYLEEAISFAKLYFMAFCVFTGHKQ